MPAWWFAHLRARASARSVRATVSLLVGNAYHGAVAELVENQKWRYLRLELKSQNRRLRAAKGDNANEDKEIFWLVKAGATALRCW